jgi:hypothetical protein
MVQVMLDGFSDLEASSIAMHEWFVTLVDSGFSEEQALKLIAFSLLNQGDDTEG